MKKENNKSVEKFKKECVRNNLRVTPQRTVIYKKVVSSKEHPSAEEVYDDVLNTMPNISFDTVYRTLTTFSEIGIVEKVEGTGDKRRFDPNTDNHHHFRCLKCDTIIDFSYDDFKELTVPQKVKNYFDITRKRVVLEGLCSKCK